MDLIWIMVAAVGARGLAMALNRIVDREIDADNPRTASRHLPSGTMSMRTAWSLAAVFLLALLLSAWQLNEVALKMAWLPVLAFVIYPYTKTNEVLTADAYRRITYFALHWGFVGLCEPEERLEP